MRDYLTVFQRALLDSVLKEYADIPREEDLPDAFSDSFKTWAAEFSARNVAVRHRAGKVLKTILIAAVIAALLAGAAMAIPAVREAIIDYFFHEDETSMGITFDPEAAATAPDTIETPYTLTHVPERFTPFMETMEKDCICIWWMDEQGQWIAFMQHPMPDDPDDPEWWTSDAEQISRRSVLMGDYLVEIIEAEDNYKLVWTNNAYLFTLELPYSVTEEEMNAIFAGWGPKE